MSTVVNNNSSPAVQSNGLPAWVSDLSNEIHAHHNLLIVAALILFGWHFSGRVLDYLSLHYSAQYQKDVATLQAQVASNMQLAAQNAAQAAQNAKDAADYKTLAQQLAASNAQLATHEQATTQATVAQQATDKALPPPALATRWTDLAGLQPTDITLTPAGFGITPTGAITTVQALETIPELKSNLADETSKDSNDTTQLAAAQALNTGLSSQTATSAKQITGLQAQITDAGKACDDKISIIKTNAAKSKRKWFVAGYVAGVGTSVTVWIVKKLYL
jgi:hypothetical protein